MHRLTRTGALPWLVCVAVALAAPAVAQDAPGGGIDLMSIVTGLMGSVNVPVLAMLTVLALTLHRAQRITAASAITIPIAIGAALGALSAVVHAQQSAGGWLMVAGLTQAVIEGAIINGGMAVVVGRLASIGYDKLFPAAPDGGG
jgi:hypothetical protein